MWRPILQAPKPLAVYQPPPFPSRSLSLFLSSPRARFPPPPIANNHPFGQLSGLFSREIVSRQNIHKTGPFRTKTRPSFSDSFGAAWLLALFAFTSPHDKTGRASWSACALTCDFTIKKKISASPWERSSIRAGLVLFGFLYAGIHIQVHSICNESARNPSRIDENVIA